MTHCMFNQSFLTTWKRFTLGCYIQKHQNTVEIFGRLWNPLPNPPILIGAKFRFVIQLIRVETLSVVAGAGPFVKVDDWFDSEKYLDILENQLLPWINQDYDGQPVCSIQDMSPIHTSRVTQHWFRQHPRIEVLPWLSKGADINPMGKIFGKKKIMIYFL